jgi:glycosyltransferase involved in cell wall biosynthesis
MVTHTLAVGGSPKSLLHVATALRAHYFEPILYYGKNGPLDATFTSAAISCRYLPKEKGLFGLHLGFIYRIVCWYRRDMIRLVYLNCLVPYYKYHALAACLMGLPVIWSIREDVGSKRARKLMWWLQKLATLVMPCSEEIAGRLRERGLSKPVRVVHNGIDLVPAGYQGVSDLRRRLHIPDDHWVIGCVGSIEVRKGQLDLIEAAGTLSPRDGPLDIVLIGEPGDRGEEDPYYQQLKRSVGRLPDHVKVHFCGVHHEVHSLYVEMDVVCLPTYWEGSSRTILEAMRARRPLLTTTAGGNPEIVRHLESAYLVPPGDRQALAGGISYLRRHPEERVALAKKAFIILKQEYAAAHYVERLGAVIDAVIIHRPSTAENDADRI